MHIQKVVATFDEAVADVSDGALVHIGGFGSPADWPGYLIAALARKNVRELTITGNNAGFGIERIAQLREPFSHIMPYPLDHYDAGLLVERGQVRKAIVTYAAFGGKLEFPLERFVHAGKIELELIGQGSLAERIRAARAGLAGFYTPVGVGTTVAEGKEVREFDGKSYLMERGLRADIALIKAWKADRHGNLIYRKTARNFNPAMATAADITIAEVEELVEPGDLDPDEIMTPGIYVDRVVVGQEFQKPIEWRFIKEHAQS